MTRERRAREEKRTPNLLSLMAVEAARDIDEALFGENVFGHMKLISLGSLDL